MIIDFDKYQDIYDTIKSSSQEKNISVLEDMLKVSPICNLTANAFIKSIDEYLDRMDKNIFIENICNALDVQDKNPGTLGKLSNTPSVIVAQIFHVFVLRLIDLDKNLKIEAGDLIELVSFTFWGAKHTFKSFKDFFYYSEKYCSGSFAILLAESLAHLATSLPIISQIPSPERIDVSTYYEFCTKQIQKPARPPKKSFIATKVSAVKNLATRNEKWFIFSICYLFIMIFALYKSFEYYDYSYYEDRFYFYAGLFITMLIGYVGAASIKEGDAQ